MIGAVIARLEAEAMPPFTAVDGAEKLASLTAGTAPPHGAAFVMPVEETGSRSRLSTGFAQRVEVEFAVAVVLRRAGDAKGGERVSLVDTYRAAIEAALAGWSHNEAAEPCEFVGASTSPAGNGVLWYVQTWRTTREIRT